mgnify:CR=1 FL=1
MQMELINSVPLKFLVRMAGASGAALATIMYVIKSLPRECSLFFALVSIDPQGMFQPLVNKRWGSSALGPELSLDFHYHL